MSIMPPVVPDDDTITLETHKWDIACDYSMHEQIGDGPAVWVLTLGPPPCGHDPAAQLFICGACLAFRTDPNRKTYCLTCHGTFPCMANVLRVERL